MLDMLHLNYSLAFFIVLGTVKGVTELYAGMSKHKGEKHSSRMMSVFFLIIGFGTPVMIVMEIVILGNILPLMVMIPLAVVALILQVARILTIRALGRFYSVDVCIFEDHKLVIKGPYKYFRHPIYIIALVDYLVYPLACGAYFTAMATGISGWTVTLIRRHQEEKVLMGKFGKKYVEYKKRTIF